MTKPAFATARRFGALVLAAGVLVTGGCLGSPTEVETYPAGFTRVLFIGNSHTYTHDVPAMLAAIAQQDGNDRYRTSSVAFPNYSLEDHWYDGRAARPLLSGEWEYVVMQQGPSAQPASQEHLAYWSQQFAALIRGAGAQPVLYQVWPHVSRPDDFPLVREAYGFAAAAVNGVLAPAGAAWVAARASDNQLSFYDADGTHANGLGAYVAALAIYAGVSGRDPMQLPARIPNASGIDESTVRKLQAAVAEVMSTSVP